MVGQACERSGAGEALVRRPGRTAGRAHVARTARGDHAPERRATRRPGRAGGDAAARRRERRWWWVAFGVLLAACATWSLSVPPMTGPDEWAHAYRAAAIVRGEPTGTPAPPPFGNALATVEVPEAVADAGLAGRCHLGEPRERLAAVESVPGASDCPELSGGSRLVPAHTSEHRAPPVYYLLVGLPTLAFPSVFGTYLMRLVGAALCSALLASAFVSLLRLRGNRLAVLGAAVALTPAVPYYAGVTNTAGLEMAATFGLWASGAALVRGPGGPDRRLVTRAGVALVLLVLARGLSPGYAALGLAALGLVAERGRVRELGRRADVRAWGALTAAAVVASGAWLVYVHAAFALPHRDGIGVADGIAELRWDLRDLVGVFGSTDVVPPVAVHLAWAGAFLLVLLAAAVWGARRHALLAAVVALGAVALLVSGEGLSVPQTGMWWQGRYVMPLVIGAALLATTGGRGADAGDAPRPARGVRLVGPPLLALLVALQLWSFLYAVRHYAVGPAGPRHPIRFLRNAEWTPPVAPAFVWAGVMAAALVAGAVLAWRASAPGLAAPGQGPGAPGEASAPAGAGDAPGRLTAREPRARPTVRA